MFFRMLNCPPKWKKPPKKNNLACLATYLIATGHHLCLHFPLLVFWALTWLISCLALIRGRISEHSRVSQTTRWETRSAINQSDFPFIVVNSGNEPNADRVGDAESELLGYAGMSCKGSGASQTCLFTQSLWGLLESETLSLLHEQMFKLDPQPLKLFGRHKVI